MKNIDANLNRDKFLRLSELGSKSGLSFSSHLVLGNRIIGLDGLKKKLLIAEFKDGQNAYCIIDLDKVKSISVKKSYSGIKPGELNERRFEEFIKSIHLHFEWIDPSGNFVIPFYESEIDEVPDLPGFEASVKNGK